MPAPTLVKVGAMAGAPLVGGLGWLLSSVLSLSDRIATIEARQSMLLDNATRNESRLERAQDNAHASLETIRTELNALRAELATARAAGSTTTGR